MVRESHLRVVIFKLFLKDYTKYQRIGTVFWIEGTRTCAKFQR